MNKDSLASFVDALRESRVLDPTQMVQVESLQAECPEPEMLVTRLLDLGCLTPFQAEQLAQGEGKSLILGQYILLERLGEGGMGQVYKARHQRMKRIVALKVIRKDVPTSPDAVRRFNLEIEAAAQLLHSNVVIAYDADEVDGTLFFVMEYVEGIDLGRLVQKEGALPVGQACDYIRQTALGLQHAHERGLVHRDIKPSNLLITFADSVVKILDMGLARFQQSMRDNSSNLTRTGTVMGTPDFISPEQARDAHSADIRSDMYSLGCTFYFLLSGHVPFPEGSFTEKLLKHNMDEPEPLDCQRSDLSPEVLAISKKLMAKRPDDRFQTPGELVEELKLFAKPDASAERYRKLQVGLSKHGDETAGSLRDPDASRSTPVGPQLEKTDMERVAGLASDWATLPHDDEVAPECTPKPPARPTKKAPIPVPFKRHRSLTLFRIGVAMLAGLGLAVAAVVVINPRAGDSTGSVVVAPTTTQPTIPVTRVAPPSGKATQPATKVAGPSTKSGDPKVFVGPLLPPIIMGPEKPPPEKVPLAPRIVVRIPEHDAKSELKMGFSRDGRWAVAGWSGSVRLYDLKADKPESKPPRLPLGYPLTALALSPDGQRALIGTSDEVIELPKPPRFRHILALWEPGEDLRVFPGHTKDITCVAFSPQGNRAISGSSDQTVRLWDLKSGAEVHCFRKHQDKVLCVAISEDGRLALSGGRDKKVYLWDLETGKEVTSFTGHENFVTCVAFSANGRYAVSGSYDTQIRLWDLQKKVCARVYSGHKYVVRWVVFSPDSRHILSGSDDGTARLWTPDAAQALFSFEDHKNSVLGVAFTGEPGLAVSGSSDNTIRSWPYKAP